MTGLESRTGMQEHSWLNKAKLALMGADKLCEGLESNDHQIVVVDLNKTSRMG